jgi:hypothetical protein
LTKYSKIMHFESGTPLKIQNNGGTPTLKTKFNGGTPPPFFAKSLDPLLHDF